MATTILDLDASGLPAAIALRPGHGRALALIRWQGRPVGHVWLAGTDGVVDGATLREAVATEVSAVVSQRRVREFVGWDDVPPLERPATLRASVAICTRDRLDDLARCLASMDALPDDGQEVIVVDSASRDGDAVRTLVARHARARYVREDRPGLDVARNRALREAGGDVVAFCDDDAVVDPRWLRALLRNFAEPRTLCVTGLTMPMELESQAQEWFESTNSFHRGYSRVVHDGAVVDAFFVSRVGAGVNMAVRRTLLELIGPFDEALDAGTATRSGGDHDLFTRVLLQGYCIVYDPEALSWHRHRREWPELLAAVEGYGTGVWAYLTRHALQGESRAPYVALAWLRWQLRQVLHASLFRPVELRLDVCLAELRGCLAGPAAYLRARRAARQALGAEP